VRADFVCVGSGIGGWGAALCSWSTECAQSGLQVQYDLTLVAGETTRSHRVSVSVSCAPGPRHRLKKQFKNDENLYYTSLGARSSKYFRNPTFFRLLIDLATFYVF
jgi:hypothetical protein